MTEDSKKTTVEVVFFGIFNGVSNRMWGVFSPSSKKTIEDGFFDIRRETHEACAQIELPLWNQICGEYDLR